MLFFTSRIKPVFIQITVLSAWRKRNITVYYFKNAFCEKKLPLIENLRIKSLSCFKYEINITYKINIYCPVEVPPTSNQFFEQME